MELPLLKWADIGDKFLNFLQSAFAEEGDKKKMYKVNGFSIQSRGEITQRKKIHFFIVSDDDLQSSEIASDIAESLIMSENNWFKENHPIDVKNIDPHGINVGGFSNRRPRLEVYKFNSYDQKYSDTPTILDHPQDIPGKEEMSKWMSERNKQ